MYRMHTVFENNSTQIVKIEGQISKEDLTAWRHDLTIAFKDIQKDVILDTCNITDMTIKAIEILAGLLPQTVYIQNCPNFIRNMLISSKLESNILG